MVWEALRAGPATGTGCDVLDIGGGTGGFAVRVAELGHRVSVVDPSPDALAALDRRARESGVADRSPASRGTWPTCSTVPAPPAPTWCCATASSRSSTTPRPRWPRSARCCVPAAPSACSSPSGTPRWSPGPWPVTSSRRSASSTTPCRPAGPGTGSPSDEITGLLADAGFGIASVHGVRVFADLVPGSLLDLEPGASSALVELEQAVAERPEYLPLATQLHVLAT